MAGNTIPPSTPNRAQEASQFEAWSILLLALVDALAERGIITSRQLQEKARQIEEHLANASN